MRRIFQKPGKIKILCFLFMLIMFSGTASAQQKKEEPKDSLKLYKDIKRIAKKRRVTSWIYDFVFTEPPPPAPKVKASAFPTKKKEDARQKRLDRYDGKIIRNLIIVTLDPFGSHIYDTTQAPLSGFEKIANQIHVKSRKFTIRNQLLFKKGDQLDPLKVKESERILRQSAYVRDAKINVLPVKNHPDSVDLIVTEQDNWSLGGSASASTTRGSVNFYEKNFLGFGQQWDNTVYYYPFSSRVDYNISYLIPYIRNTFITGRLFYNKVDLNTTEGFSFNRDFISSLTRWAGGSSLIWSHTSTSPPIKFIQQDHWLGHSFGIIKGDDELSRSSRILLSARFFQNHYTSRIGSAEDTLSPYLDSRLYLASIAFSQRTYYKDNYIYRYGRMEDVPEGRLIALIGGIEDKFPYVRNYVGVRASFARHFEDFGYFSNTWEYGTFTRGGIPERGVLNVFLNYFSDLMTSGKWRIRQFVNFNLSHGINRYKTESISLNTNGIYGFSNPSIIGTDRLALNLQTVNYLPYRVLGFNFAPVVFAGFGMLGNSENNVLRSKIYQVFGLGLLIRNENLVINTIQLSFGLYPNIGDGDFFKFNPASVYDLRFRELFISRPDIIPFQ